MKIAVGYVRCSTDEQGATSIPQQKAEIERWAVANQFEIADWFSDEGRSGTGFDKRPAFNELVRRIENKPNFQFVLVYDESRWGRAINPRENSYWKMHFDRHGVRVRMVHSGSKNGNDIGSYVVEVIESAEASEYSKKLSRSIRRGMLSPQQGKYSRGGTSPYGFKRIAVDLQTGSRRELTPGSRSVPRQEKVVWDLGEPIEVETVRRIFEMKSKGYGQVAIANRLNEEGIPCPKRGRWRNKDQRWAGVTVHDILRNQAYIGERVYNRRTFSMFVSQEKGLDFVAKRTNAQSEWIIAQNAHPEIVSRDLFEKANSMMEKHAVRPNQHYYHSPYLLSGLVTCVHCSFNFQGYHNTPTGIRYYVDGGRKNKGESVCSYFSIRQDKLDGFVLDSIRRTFLESDLRQRVEEEIVGLLKSETADHSRMSEILEQRLHELNMGIKNLLVLAEKGINLDNLAKRISELEIEQKRLRAEQSQAERHKEDEIDLGAISTAVLRFFEEFSQNFERLPLIDRKAILRRIVERILVDKKKKVVRCFLKRLPDVGLAGKLPKAKVDFNGAESSLNGNRTRI